MKHTALVHGFLELTASAFPNKDALFASGKWHSYEMLNSLGNQVAHCLRGHGLRRGDRIGLLMENSMEYVASYYGILKSGGTTVALNTESTADDLSYIFNDCGIRFLITNHRFFLRLLAPGMRNDSGVKGTFGTTLQTLFVWSDKMTNGIDAHEIPFVSFPGSLETFPRDNPSPAMIDLDVASIVYTSGSTGKPRGAVLSHLNIVANTRSIADYLGLTSEDRIMAVLPFYYIYGKSLLNTHFFAGGSVVIENRFLYPNIVLQAMKDHEVTGFAGVPSTFTILLARSNLKSSSFPKLRYVTQAGGPMAPSVQKEVAKHFQPARLYVMYGATEASARLSYLHPDDLPRKWGSIGKAIPNVELFVADNRGTPCPAGVEGEIVARGSNIMSGYWNHPEETEKILKKGLYYTGDIGKTDEEGFIYVVGRIKDMIKIGGNRVSAKEIEEALSEHPLVLEVAVVGVPDDVLGEAPKAYVVVPKEFAGNAAQELQGFLETRLAAFKIPKLYEIRDSLPKNESGKIQKLRLR
jgi:long-chain acyl-CoA synthetase